MSTRDRSPMDPREVRLRATWVLALSLGLTLTLYTVPLRLAFFTPLALLVAITHELSHGLTAAGLGQRFEELVLYPNGFGVAQMTLSDSSSIRATIAACGLFGPPFGAAVAFIGSTHARVARLSLVGLSVALLLVLALFVRTPFGFVALGFWAAVFGAVGARASAPLCQWVLVFVAVEFGLSGFAHSYLLPHGNEPPRPNSFLSDNGTLATTLGGTPELWQGAAAILASATLLFGIWVVSRFRVGPTAQPPRPDRP